MRVKGRWILLALMAVGLALLASASLVERPAELREAAELPPAPSATHWAAESAALPEMPNAAPRAQTRLGCLCNAAHPRGFHCRRMRPGMRYQRLPPAGHGLCPGPVSGFSPGGYARIEPFRVPYAQRQCEKHRKNGRKRSI